MSELLIDQHETAIVQRPYGSVFRLFVPRVRPRLAPTELEDATTALTRQNHDMLFIAATVVSVVVIILWLLRRRKSKGLDYLGVVSQRWIADERSSSHDGLR